MRKLTGREKYSCAAFSRAVEAMGAVPLPRDRVVVIQTKPVTP